VVIFNLFHIGISRSHNLNHKFCMPFFNRVFFKKDILFVFIFWRICFYTNELYFIKKIIFLICFALHNIFSLFYSISFICVTIFIIFFIDFNKQISRQKQVNIVFCGIKYLDLHPSLNFFNFSFSLVNNFFFNLFIYYIDNYRFYLISSLHKFINLHLIFLCEKIYQNSLYTNFLI